MLFKVEVKIFGMSHDTHYVIAPNFVHAGRAALKESRTYADKPSRLQIVSVDMLCCDDPIIATEGTPRRGGKGARKK